MRDLLPDQMRAFRRVEDAFREVAGRWGYEEIRTPTVESYSLFTAAGALSPEMLAGAYTFLDWDGWSGERVMLRYDSTIPVARAAADAAAASGASRSGGAPAPDLSLAFHDAGGAPIREFRPKPDGWDELNEDDRALDPGPWMPVRPGVNRFVWDLRHPGAMRLRGNRTAEEANRGPLVLPGTYEVRLRVGDRTLAESFEVVNDPRSPAGIDELREQLDCLLAMRDKISEIYAGVQRIRDVNAEVERWCARLARHGGHDAAVEAGAALREALAAVASALILPGEHTDTFRLHHRARLNESLASVIGIVDSADARPTTQARALAEEYMARIDAELERLAALLDHDLRAFSDLVSEAGLPPVDMP